MPKNLNAESPKKPSVWRALLNWRMLVVLFMGFASGLPLALVGQTLKAWATDAGWTLTAIGSLSILTLPYSLKFILAPLLDYYVPPFLGRRRGWLFCLQIALTISIFALSGVDPTTQVTLFVLLGFCVATFAALQDVVIDAYRREFLSDEEFGLGISLAMSGYRGAMYVSAGLAFFMADQMSWGSVYKIMAAASIVGIVTTLLTKEPIVEIVKKKSIVDVFIGPFKELLSRPGIAWILGFVLLYKFGDAMASQMTTPFYMKIGFTKTEIGAIVKSFGIGAIIVGGLAGGAIIIKIGLRASLWFFGFLQAISTLAFAWLAHIGPSQAALIGVISFENIAAGMGTAAYSAFMAKMTNKQYTATQYAVMTSLMSTAMTFGGPIAGWLAEHFGWQTFFVICTLLAIPGMLLLFKVGKWADTQTSAEPPVR